MHINKIAPRMVKKKATRKARKVICFFDVLKVVSILDSFISKKHYLLFVLRIINILFVFSPFFVIKHIFAQGVSFAILTTIASLVYAFFQNIKYSKIEHTNIAIRELLTLVIIFVTNLIVLLLIRNNNYNFLLDIVT